MTTILIIICIITASIQSVFKKYNSQILSGSTISFNAVSSFAAMCFFVATALVSGISFPADISLYLYSVGFAAAYGSACLMFYLALECGPFGLTSLIISYSLVLPTIYGLVWLDEPLTVLKTAGLVFLLISLWLVRPNSGGKEKITSRWVIFTIIAFVGNGFCTIIQKSQQLAFDGMYKSEFMIAALIIVTAVFTVFAFIKERGTMKQFIRHGTVTSVLCGAANGLTNYLVMVITATVAASVFFPVISAGQIIFAFLCSFLLYKEKLSKPQVVGVIFGVAALVLLNQ